MNIREQRQRLAYETARLMAREGMTDLRQARHKAARLLDITDKAALPDDAEVRKQLREYQDLFGNPEDASRLLRLKREAALAAMAYFKTFQPRLAGAVFDGTAAAHSAIVLHLHSDEFEAVARLLLDGSIPAQAGFTRMRIRADKQEDFPCWSFFADQQAFELVVLPLACLRQAPLDAEGKPMPRASMTALAAMLGQTVAGST